MRQTRAVADFVTTTASLAVCAAVLFPLLRRRQVRAHGALTSRPELVEDRERRRRALEINDGIVQGLVSAKLALELGQRTVSQEALESTLVSARGLMTELLGEVSDHPTVSPGELQRARAALVSGA